MISVAKLLARMKQGSKGAVSRALNDSEMRKKLGMGAGIVGAGGLGTAGGYGLAQYSMDLDKKERECLPRGM